MITALPLSQIILDHLVRDRVAVQDDDMDALVNSIRDRGQQTPIEVMVLENGTFGLISGWQRCTAIAQLCKDGLYDGTVLAIERQASDASGAYLAMVEENEISVGLSHFERARIAIKTVELGVYETDKKALLGLFRTASRAKRSKIRSFLNVVRDSDGALSSPQSSRERLGLELSSALDGDANLAENLRAALDKAAPQDAATEQKLLPDALAARKKEGSNKAKNSPKDTGYLERDLGPGLSVRVYKSDGHVELNGPALTPDLRARLLHWLEKRI